MRPQNGPHDPDDDWAYLHEVVLGNTQRVAQHLRDTGNLDADAVAYLSSSGALPNTALKKIEASLRQDWPNLDGDIGEILRGWAAVVERSEQIKRQITDPHQGLIDACHGAGIGEPLEVLPGPESTTKFTYAIKTTQGTYFAQHHSSGGKLHLPAYPPSRSVYVHLLGESLFRLVLGDGWVTPTLWPTIDLAATPGHRADCSGPASTRHTVLQSLATDHQSMSGWMRRPERRNQAAAILGGTIGETISRSTGLRDAAFEGSIHSNHPAVELLRRHKQALLAPDPTQFRRWLEHDSWIAAKVRLLPLSHSRILSSVRALGLFKPSAFASLCDRSEERFRASASISQADLMPQNILVRESAPHERLICDFEYVSLMDPAIDIGMALYGISINGLRDGYASEIPKLTHTFLAAIESESDEIRSNEFGGRLNLGAARADACIFAGVTLLAVCSHDYLRRYDAAHDEVVQLVASLLAGHPPGER